MEQHEVPLRRLTWLVGPPGAGKSTFARTQSRYGRVVELTEMLGPLVDSQRIRHGVLTANGRLVRLIRELELRPENCALSPLLIVAGLVPEEALFPIGAEEVVLLLRPEEKRWRRQLRSRPVGHGSSGQYDDYAYSELWHARFATWLARRGVHLLEIPFQEELVGVSIDPLP